MSRCYVLFVLIIALLAPDVSAQPARAFRFPEGTGPSDFDPLTLMVKIKDQPVNQNIPGAAPGRQASGKDLRPSDLTTVANATSYESFSSIMARLSNGRTRPSTYLQGIYQVTLQENADIEQEINKLLQYENVVYAEPIYLEKPLFVPNDPSANPAVGSQAHLNVIRAYEAWDIQQGKPEVTIAVLDTGVDPDHPDLVDNLLLNSNDPLNGVDDDSDGLIDNFQGYDFADSDPDPTADQNAHGVLVAGLSSATTNNGSGVAGTGFNSTFVPYKIFRSSDGKSNNSYAAILFAAQKGHQVMNLSWGAPNFFSQFNQDIINSAVLDYGAILVAAAGNTPTEVDFYPASYEHVISVTSNNLNDTKSSFSSYSYHVDLSAPGTSNYTTKNGGTYGFSGTGTSFASPLVAGAAALLRAEFPHWTAHQIIEQLRATSDDVYDQGTNNDFFGQLGKGRLNMFEALKDTTYKSVRLSSLEYDNGFGQFAFYSDTLELTTVFQNFLQPVLEASVTVTSNSPYIQLFSGNISLGNMATLESTNAMTGLRIILAENTPAEERILLRFDFNDFGYNDWQFKQIFTTPDYVDVGTNQVTFTVAGNGNLGYQLDEQRNGNGFMYSGKDLINSAGIMIAADGIMIDNAIENFEESERNFDFSTHKNIRYFNNSTADLFGLSFFDDSDAGVNEKELFIEQKALSWNNPEDQNYLILEYRISNKGNNDITDLKLGLFSDWAIENATANSVAWDAANQLGYSNHQGNVYGGIAMLSSFAPIFHAIDLSDENGNTPELGIMFSKSEKLSFLSGGVNKTSAGSGGGNNVAQVLGGEIGGLASGESKKVAFALVAGDNLSQLQSALTEARNRYNTFLVNPPVVLIDTTCLNSPTTLSLDLGNSFLFYSDPLGNDLIHTGNDFLTGNIDKDTTFYIQNTDETFRSDLRSLEIKAHQMNPQAIIPDFYFLGDDTHDIVHFEDQTFKATGWLWDFDNGAGSTAQNPAIQFKQVGDYQVRVDIQDKFGCTGQYSKMLKVRERGPEPAFNDFIVCQNQPVTITSVENNQLRVYTTATSTTVIFEGQSFTSGPINSDTVFYISNIDPEFESRRVAVPVNIIDLDPIYDIRPDTTDLTSRTTFQLVSLNQDATSVSWVVNTISRNEESPIVNIAGLTQLDLELSLSNTNSGCTNSLQETVYPMTSPIPVTSDLLVCPGTPVTISPSGGDYFYFYSDPGLEQLIHKGRSLLLQGLNSDTSFYVTNIDRLVESSSATIKVEVIPFQADFSMTPNPLILENGNQVAFNDQSPEAKSWQWYLDGQMIETARSPVLTIDSPGTHEIKLVVANGSDCVMEATRTLEVMAVTGIDETAPVDIYLYPNPARETVTFFIDPDRWRTPYFEIIDLAGKRVLNGNLVLGNNELWVKPLSPGMYTLKVIDGAGVSQHRLIKY